MCSEEEKTERIEMMATLFYWGCLDDISRTLDWCQIRGFLSPDDCKKVIERRDYIDRAEEYANEHWRDVDEQINSNAIRKMSCYGC